MITEADILGKKLLVIAAHPDDEAFLAAGTIYENGKRGGTTELYSATIGEKGSAHVAPNTTEEQLKVIRKKELEDAAKYLGIQKIILDSFPDRDLEHQELALRKRIEEVIEEEKPDYILGFGKNGYTGHKDHMIIGVIAKEISQKLDIPYLAFCHPPKDLFGDISQFLINKRAKGSYFDEIENEEPNLTIPVSPEIKLKALELYQSQFPGLDPRKIFPANIAELLLANEYFKLN